MIFLKCMDCPNAKLKSTGTERCGLLTNNSFLSAFSSTFQRWGLFLSRGLTWRRHWGLLTCRRELWVEERIGPVHLLPRVHWTSRANWLYKRQNLPQMSSTWGGGEAGLSIPEGVQASKPPKGMKNTNILLMSRKIMSQQLKSVLVVHSWVPQRRFCLFVYVCYWEAMCLCKFHHFLLIFWIPKINPWESRTSTVWLEMREKRADGVCIDVHKETSIVMATSILNWCNPVPNNTRRD